MYDAIVIGARCAGSPTAMLLAQKGYKVLLVDKASFPSDTISTHGIWPPGVARLKRWGLLEKVIDSNCPAIGTIGFDVGPIALKGSLPAYEGVTDFIAPRRTILDKVLLDAAIDAGAEFRENCAVEQVLADNDRVTGIRSRTRDGGSVTDKARIVIGADGRNSFVARSVGASIYNSRPALACWYYTYWSGLPTEEATYYSRPGRCFGVIPTNDDTACVAVAWKNEEFAEFRSDIEGNFFKTLELAPDLAEQVREAKREERFYGTADLPNFFRKPFGPGWALVGDAGYHKDPLTAQGISDAFRDAEALADALDQSWSGRKNINEALDEFERNRNEEVTPMYEYTCQLASLEPPPPEIQQLFGALIGNRADTDRFFGVIAGTVPVPEFYSPENIQRMLAVT